MRAVFGVIPATLCRVEGYQTYEPTNTPTSGLKGSVWTSDSRQSVCTPMDVRDMVLVYLVTSMAAHLRTSAQLSLLARKSEVKSSGTWLTSGAYLMAGTLAWPPGTAGRR